MFVICFETAVLTVASNPAESAGTGLEVVQGGEEVVPTKIGPVFFRDVDFRVAELPEEEIRNPHFPRGADEQVGVGNASCMKMGFEYLRGNGLRIQLSLSHFAGKGLHGIEDFGTPTVAQGEGEVEFGIRGRRLHRLAQLALTHAGELVNAADMMKSDALANHLISLLVQKIFQQKHESVDLQRRSLPVFGRKGVEREVLHTGVQASLHAALDGLRACLVSSQAWKPALLRPASIAIHDNGNMFWGSAHDQRRIV